MPFTIHSVQSCDFNMELIINRRLMERSSFFENIIASVFSMQSKWAGWSAMRTNTSIALSHIALKCHLWTNVDACIMVKFSTVLHSLSVEVNFLLWICYGTLGNPTLKPANHAVWECGSSPAGVLCPGIKPVGPVGVSTLQVRVKMSEGVYKA